MPDEMTSWGEFSVLTLVILLSAFLVGRYCQRQSPKLAAYIFGIGGGGTLLGTLFSNYVIPFNVCHLQLALCGGIILTLAFFYLRERLRALFLCNSVRSWLGHLFLLDRLCIQSGT